MIVKLLKKKKGGITLARVLKNKKLENTRLATNYGGWMYCTNCNRNIGYLCYITYDRLQLQYECNCGSHGSAFLDFEDSQEDKESKEALITVKNRLCCPEDSSPLITMLSKNLNSYAFTITCKACGKTYMQHKKE